MTDPLKTPSPGTEASPDLGPGFGPETDAPHPAEYLLGLLGPSEVRAFEARLATDPALRARLALWAEDLAALGGDLPAQDPPPDHWPALKRALFPEDSLGWWRRIGLVPALIAAVLAALLVLAVSGRNPSEPAAIPPPDLPE